MIRLTLDICVLNYFLGGEFLISSNLANHLEVAYADFVKVTLNHRKTTLLREFIEDCVTHLEGDEVDKKA